MVPVLPDMHITIREDEHKSLNADVWSQDFVRAELWTGRTAEPIQLRYRGGHTRDYPKRSYEIKRGTITLHLNAEYDDPSMIRNALSFQFFEWIGVPSPKTNHCRLTLNGRSLGVYLEIEAVEQPFFYRREIPCQSLFYAVNGKADFSVTDPDTGRRKSSLLKGYERMIGKESDKKYFTSFINNLNTLKNMHLYRFLFANLDIENYLRWLAGVVFTGNYDGFDQNYAIYLHRSNRRFRMIPWDYEGTWGRNCFGKRVPSNLVRVTGYNQLTKKLLAYPVVKRRYKAILKEILEGTFTTTKISSVVNRLHGNIVPYLYRENTGKWSFQVFNGEPLIIENYIRERREIIAKSISAI